MLKRTGLFATLTIATAVSLMNAPVQAQTTPTDPVTAQPAPVYKLASEAAITVVSSDIPVSSRNTISLKVACPQNTIAISGGGSVNPNSGNTFLKSSFPDVSTSGKPTGWQITGINLTGSNVTFSVYAICAQTAP